VSERQPSAGAFVAFRAGGSEWAIPVDQAREVRVARGLAPLPAPAPGVVGLMTGGEVALPVLGVLAAHGSHVLVVESEGRSFGLLVDEVVGVRQAGDVEVGPPPAGQDAPLVAAVLLSGGAMSFVLDASALARALGP
jgi:chemotaxis signal transduction protein